MEEPLITTVSAYENSLRESKRHGFYWGALAAVTVMSYINMRREEKQIVREVTKNAKK